MAPLLGLADDDLGPPGVGERLAVLAEAAVDELVSVGVRGGRKDGAPRTPITITSVRLD